MAFSERMGLRSARNAMQIESMDAPLRIGLFNYLYQTLHDNWEGGNRFWGPGFAFGKTIWTEYWRKRSDNFDTSAYVFAEHLHDYIEKSEWFEVYDLIEFCLRYGEHLFDVAGLNAVLQRDMSGYRVRENIVVPITDEIELSALDEALTLDDAFRGARQHLALSLEKLSHRPQPDLRNAIKEAISAVESAARVVTGHHKATLGDALRVLEQNGHVHSALKQAWLKIYGYTSDEGGVRHAMLDDPAIDFATAKYMLVACAGFVNLLAARTE